MSEKLTKQFSKDLQCIMVRTGSPNVVCSILPSHWRSNKQLPHKFMVAMLTDVPDGTKVSLSVANENNAKGDMKNNVAIMQNQIAVFPDLRFVGRSGRGKYFHLVITIHCYPSQVAVYENAIKVTIDGPRLPRNKHKILNSDHEEFDCRPKKRQKKFLQSFISSSDVLPDSSNNF